jgi:subtilisin family serine protease
MDSLGVRLVNSSLGYSTGFDNPAENYRPEQMDGSSFIARAVQMAVEQKGMLLVISAGNDGENKKWRILSTPADAPGVLTIGSTEFYTWAKQGYSSIGAAFVPYLKPDLACFATTGTSFSAPIIAGLAACLLEANSALSPRQLTHILKKSGHLYPFGNNYVGYGVPDARKALALALDSTASFTGTSPEILTMTGKTFQYRVSTARASLLDNGGIMVYRKSSATQVIRQEKLATRTRHIKLKRLPQETHTTVQVGAKVMELVWQ